MLPSDKVNIYSLKGKLRPLISVFKSLSFDLSQDVTTEKSGTVEIIQKDRANVNFVILFGAGLVYKRARHRLLWGSKESQRE